MALTIGTFASLRYLHEFREEPLSFMNDLHKKHGDMVELSIGPKKILFCFHPAHAEHILKTNAESYRKSRLIFDKLLPLTGANGLVQIEGQRGGEERQITGASLSIDALQQAYPLMVRSILQGIDSMLRDAENGREIDLSTHITDIVLRNALILVFGTDEDFSAFGQAFLDANDVCGQKIRSLVSAPLIFPTKQNQRLKAAIKTLDSIVYAAIDRRIRAPISYTQDLLSILIKANASKKQIRDHVLTFLFAGHETTASSLTWTFYLLSQHPEVETAVSSECHDRRSLMNEGLLQLRAFKKTVHSYQEALRLFPPSWTLAREATIADEIDGHRINKGTLILIGVPQIHKHPLFWSESGCFMPSRFESNQNRQPFTFIPFGGGERICIGMRIAYLEAALVLALVLTRVRIRVREGFYPKVAAMITAHPQNGLPVTLEEILGSACRQN